MVIYSLIDPRNNQLRYIGKTGQKVEKRYNFHLSKSGLKSKTYKNNWIRGLLKEGLKPELFIIDDSAKNEKQLNELECFYIAYFNSLGCNLTNLTLGGEGNLGRILSLKTRKKISKANIGKKLSLETRKKLSKAHKGKIYTEAQKQIFSDKQKKYKVIDLDTLEIFPSMMSVCKKYNYSTGFLSDHLNKEKNISIKGKFFKWLPKNIINIEKWALKQKTKSIKNKEFKDQKKYQYKSIICINTGKLYESIIQASKELNCSSSGICDVLKGNKQSIFGYKFKYANGTKK